MAQIQSNIEHIVDFQPKNGPSHDEYSYNVSYRTESGILVEKLWAGPSHWKLKCMKPAGMYSLHSLSLTEL